MTIGMIIDESEETMGTTSGLADLFAQLDATSAAGREADAIRADRDPMIPKLEHSISYEWRPPISQEEVLKTVSKDCCRLFKTANKKAGDLFRKEGILKHKHMPGTWEDNRVTNAVPQRSIGNPKGRPGVVRYHQHSDPLPEPTDEQLHPQHGAWLKEHRKRRDKHLHPLHHALKRVEKAEEIAKDVQKKRETARDLMTRGVLVSPKLSDGVKNKLAMAKVRLKTTTAMNKLVGIDVLGDQEKKDLDNLQRARSAPCLELKPCTPRHRARHLRSWKGPDRRWAWTQTDQCLKHTTPGVFQEEERELHEIPKYRLRGA
jgi:hypothetical protein